MKTFFNSGLGKKESWKRKLIKNNESRETWGLLYKAKDSAATPKDDLIEDEKTDYGQCLYNKKGYNDNHCPI